MLKFIFLNTTVHLFENIFIAASVAAYGVVYSITFPIGFTLSRYIVFPESNLHGRKQFFRYVLAQAFFIFMNYILIKAFDKMLDVLQPKNLSYALLHTITYTIINVIIAVLSYISQRKFTFKITEEDPIKE